MQSQILLEQAMVEDFQVAIKIDILKHQNLEKSKLQRAAREMLQVSHPLELNIVIDLMVRQVYIAKFSFTNFACLSNM